MSAEDFRDLLSKNNSNEPVQFPTICDRQTVGVEHNHNDKALGKHGVVPSGLDLNDTRFGCVNGNEVTLEIFEPEQLDKDQLRQLNLSLRSNPPEKPGAKYVTESVLGWMV